MIKSLLFAGFGGFLGTVLRLMASRLFQPDQNTLFPWNTLLINITGSFLIGVFIAVFEKGVISSSEWRLFLTVGICGGFTTFSTFSADAIILLQNKDLLRFSLYAGSSVVFGIIAIFTGKALIESLYKFIAA